jgi:hypothetical protein
MAESIVNQLRDNKCDSTRQLYELHVVTEMMRLDLFRGTGVGYKREDRYGGFDFLWFTDGHLKVSNPQIPAMQFQRLNHPFME